MKIKPLPNTDPPQPPVLDTIKDLEKWFSESSASIEISDENAQEQSKEIVFKEGENENEVNIPACNGKLCTLEFYYFDVWPLPKGASKVDGFRNGIWVKIKNVKNVWIRIGIDRNNLKKVNVFSDCEMKPLKLEEVKSYSLPEDFKKRGVYMSNKGQSGSEQDLKEIIKQIYGYLKGVCSIDSIE